MYIREPALVFCYLVVMDAISEHAIKEVLWDMLYAADLIVADKEKTEI